MKFNKHYDFGLRTIKAVLLHARMLKLRSKNVKSQEVFALRHAREEIATHLATFVPYK